MPRVTIATGGDHASFNDKESITADPHDPNVAYVTWSRGVSPEEHAHYKALTYSRAIRSGVWFSRTTDGGKTWEPAREISDDAKMNAWASFAQIVVLPNGDLVNVFTSERNPYAKPSKTGTSHPFTVSAIRSTDRGVTWSQAVVIGPLNEWSITDPESGALLRTGGLDVGVDPSSGRLYVTWPHRFEDSNIDVIALSMSSDWGADMVGTHEGEPDTDDDPCSKPAGIHALCRGRSRRNRGADVLGPPGQRRRTRSKGRAVRGTMRTDPRLQRRRSMERGTAD